MKFLRSFFKRIKQGNSTSSLQAEIREFMNEQGDNDLNNPSTSYLEEKMQQLLNGPGPDEFYAAMLNLQSLGKVALPRLKEVAGDSTQPKGFRARAVETAAMIGGKDIGSFLIKSAADPEFQVRWSAVRMIEKLQIHEALPILKKLSATDHTEWEVSPGFILSMDDAVTDAITAIEGEANRL